MIINSNSTIVTWVRRTISSSLNVLDITLYNITVRPQLPLQESVILLQKNAKKLSLRNGKGKQIGTNAIL